MSCTSHVYFIIYKTVILIVAIAIIYGSYAIISILADTMAINCFVICTTEMIGHVIIMTSYKHNNEGA